MVKKHIDIIAEIANNHNGDFEHAKKMLLSACKTGTDIVKFQCLNGDSFAVETHSYYKDVYLKLIFTESQWAELRQIAQENGVKFAVDVLDDKAVEIMKNIRPDFVKIHCGDINNFDLIGKIVALKIPIYLHTGYATLEETKAAVNFIRENGVDDITVMFGHQDYPTKMSDLNLDMIRNLKTEFNLPIGFMDHTDDIIVPILSLGFGVDVIEKHFTLDRASKNFDWQSSIEPDMFKKMVSQIRSCEDSFGTGEMKLSDSDVKHRIVVRKKIVALEDIPKGTIITRDMVGLRRANGDLEPDKFDKIIGKTARIEFKKNESLTLEGVL